MGPPGPQGNPLANYIGSAPPVGMLPVINIYWNPITQKLEGEYNDLLTAEPLIKSLPPPGMNMVTNLYWNPVLGRLVGEYEDEA